MKNRPVTNNEIVEILLIAGKINDNSARRLKHPVNYIQNSEYKDLDGL